MLQEFFRFLKRSLNLNQYKIFPYISRGKEILDGIQLTFVRFYLVNITQLDVQCDLSLLLFSMKTLTPKRLEAWSEVTHDFCLLTS